MTTTAPEKIEWTYVSSTDAEVTACPHTLSDETKTISHPLTGKPVTLRRLVALTDYPEGLGFGDIKAGDKGGWVQSLDNLDWVSWVADDSMVFDEAELNRCSLVSGDSRVYGKAVLDWGAGVASGSEVYGNAHLAGTIVISEGSTVRGDVYFAPAYLEVTNGTTLEGSFSTKDLEERGHDPGMDEFEFNDGQVHSDLLTEILAYYEEDDEE